MSLLANTPQCMKLMFNKLLVTDTQQQVAASRRLLRAGQRQRYTSTDDLSAL